MYKLKNHVAKLISKTEYIISEMDKRNESLIFWLMLITIGPAIIFQLVGWDIICKAYAVLGIAFTCFVMYCFHDLYTK